MRLKNDTVSLIGYLTLGVSIGIAAGALLTSYRNRRWGVSVTGEEPEQERPGVVSRILGRIPARVKFGAGVGAVKGGTRAGYRGIRERFQRGYD